MKEEKEQKKGKTGNELVTKESVGAVGAIFSFFVFLILLTGTRIFGDIGYAIKSFVLGTTGYFSYLFLPVLFFVSASAFAGKNPLKNKAFRRIFFLACVSFLLAHAVATYSWGENGYLSACFKNAGYGAKSATPAGWFGALFVYFLKSATGNVGAIVILSIVVLIFALAVLKTFTGISVLKAAFGAAKKNSDSESDRSLGTQTRQKFENPPEQTSSYPRAPSFENGAYVPASNEKSEPSAPVRPAYIPVTPEVRQRPGVLLSDENYGRTSTNVPPQNAFSPFGYAADVAKRDALPEKEFKDERAFLFGGNPAENYRKNLIFDENAMVNKKPAVDPRQPAFDFGTGGSVSESYTAAYESAVAREPERIRPEKISGGEYYDRERPIRETPISENTIREPKTEVSDERRTNEFLSSRPVSGEETKERTFGRESRESFLFDETPTETLDTESRRQTETPAENIFLDGENREENNVRDREPDLRNIFSVSNPNIFGGGGEDDAFLSSMRRENDAERERGKDLDIFDEDEGDGGDYRLVTRETPENGYTESSDSPVRRAHADEVSRERSFTERRFSERRFEQESSERRMPEARSVEPIEPPAPVPPPPPKQKRPYTTAPIDFFDCKDVEPDANEDEVGENKQTILETLTAFKVADATIASVTHGPTVTRYNVAVPRSISPRKVVSLDQEIAINLHARGGVNIYPNFEDGAVSIEVPNKKRQFVALGCMLTDDGFNKTKPTALTFAMGKDVGNRKVYGDIRKMTHLLVAGASGSGKSVFLRCLIVSLIVKYSPADLRLILIDPKKTEFVIYDHLPHLVINEIITETPKVIQSLNWAIGEMNRRYSLFEQKSRAGTYVVNIDEYNSNLAFGEEKLPKIVIIVDELADLMLAAKKDIEDRIQNLTQKSRAAGIHMILATQRPSTDVITGIIKSNLKTRIAFSVASDVDSRVILDVTGAQKLLGMGDMLYTVEGMNAPVRVQSASLESEDAQRVVNYIKEHNDCDYDESATAYINNTRGDGAPVGDSDAEEAVEEVYIDAVRFVILSGSASISMIQRKCSVGYNKAGKIIEWMEDMGYISAFDGAKARKVLITKDEFEEKYGPL